MPERINSIKVYGLSSFNRSAGLQKSYIETIRGSISSKCLSIFVCDEFYSSTPPENTVFIQTEKDSQRSIENIVGTISKLIAQIGIDSMANVSISGLDFDVEDEIEQAVFSVSQLKKGELVFLRNMARNLKSIRIQNSWKVEKSFRNFNAVICGAGPSLLENIEILKANQEKIYIISVGRVYETLLSHGIIPDAICEIDPWAHTNWHEFKEKIDIPLFAPVEVSPFVPEQFKKTFWTFDSGDICSCISNMDLDFPRLETGNNVSLYAAEIALSVLGFSNIGLIGVDLCYSTNDKGAFLASHADCNGSIPDARDVVNLRVDGDNGDEHRIVATNGVFISMAQSFSGSRIIKNTNTFNCSENGLPINGIMNISFEDFCNAFSSSEKKNSVINHIQDGYGKKVSNPQIDMYSQFQNNYEYIVNRHVNWMAQESPVESISEFQQFARLAKLDIEMEVSHCECEGFDFRDGIQSLALLQLSILRRKNPEFADYINMGEFMDDSTSKQFKIHQRLMGVPFVEFIDKIGKSHALSCQIEISSSAYDCCLKWVESNNFNPDEDTVYFPFPGNYAHVLAFSRMFPKSKIVIYEKTPALFRSMLLQCQFVHLLPDDTKFIWIGNEINEDEFRLFKKFDNPFVDNEIKEKFLL